ncbi:Uncharacterised protein [Zhongshania aliphaticivorans]|uniref:Uncharacterized protein n=1 Tax=Zhongshania aliphaticivorans TaxID=1470434 RepID=A0A5S9N894_9GAMM|nr:DUF6489 family protein [Zhongshania aliphaticivorans]CAA0079304.1 Uncharacterised protein [Zhongshania aliphaticivorans]CAA0086213.1 Uncharacterised protein [Zhongshania aliphaticivorans]
MKIHVEVEITPEEMRRLVGLPDAQPLWDAVYKRIAEGDSEMIQQVAKTAFTEGMKTIDLSARVLKSLSGLASNRKSTDKQASEEDSSSDKEESQKTTPRKANATRRSASSKPKT